MLNLPVVTGAIINREKFPCDIYSERPDSFWCLRRLELIANYVVEASVLTIVLFCVKFAKDVDDLLYKWKTFRRTSLHQSQISDEGLCAETSAIYVNCQHLRGFYTKENYRGNARLDYIINREKVLIAIDTQTST